MVSCCQLEFIFVNCVRGEGDRTKIQIWSFEEKPDSLVYFSIALLGLNFLKVSPMTNLTFQTKGVRGRRNNGKCFSFVLTPFLLNFMNETI